MKKVILFILSLSMLFFLSGCSGNSTPAPGSIDGYDEGEEYLSIWVHSIEDTEEGAVYRKSVESFNEKYNGK